jgi:hypothetical protein
MTIAYSRIATATNRSSDPRMFQTLGMAGVALALWQRTLPQSLSAQIDGLKSQHLPRSRGTVSRLLSADSGRCR